MKLSSIISIFIFFTFTTSVHSEEPLIVKGDLVKTAENIESKYQQEGQKFKGSSEYQSYVNYLEELDESEKMKYTTSVCSTCPKIPKLISEINKITKTLAQDVDEENKTNLIHKISKLEAFYLVEKKREDNGTFSCHSTPLVISNKKAVKLPNLNNDYLLMFGGELDMGNISAFHILDKGGASSYFYRKDGEDQSIIYQVIIKDHQKAKINIYRLKNMEKAKQKANVVVKKNVAPSEAKISISSKVGGVEHKEYVGAWSEYDSRDEKKKGDKNTDHFAFNYGLAISHENYRPKDIYLAQAKLNNIIGDENSTDGNYMVSTELTVSTKDIGVNLSVKGKDQSDVVSLNLTGSGSDSNYALSLHYGVEGDRLKSSGRVTAEKEKWSTVYKLTDTTGRKSYLLGTFESKYDKSYDKLNVSSPMIGNGVVAIEYKKEAMESNPELVDRSTWIRLNHSF
jgi:hypothetical protein